MKSLRLNILLLATVLFAVPALAVIEEHSFNNADQETRYHKLIDEMRCPKCLNANLSGSDAPIAADLRAEIYDQIMDGKTDTDIINFMTLRYGDFIMYRPPLNLGTALLWFGPLALLILGFIIARRLLASVKLQSNGEALSTEESKELDALLRSPKD